jgi:putative FmdB family regulatory protein
MPTYGYRCKDCGSEFERFQKMTDAPVTTCDSCGGAVKRLLYPVGIQFKGSGFYVNDSKSSGGDSGGSNGKSSEGSETKTESKPDAPAAPAPATTETKPAASS